MDWDASGAPPLDALFVAGTAAERAFAVRMALRHGVPVLAEWPAAASRREFEALVALSEEAGVELAVARTVRHLGMLVAAPCDARLVLIARTVAPARSLVAVLPDVLDVVARLVGSFDVRRVEASAVRAAAAAPHAVGLSVRFASGALALATLAHGAGGEATSFTAEAHRAEPAADVFRAALPPSADGQRDARDRETAAFLARLGTGHPPTASVMPLLRLMERVAARLR